MAFTGTPTFTMVSDSICQITGLSLATGATGVIGLAQHTGNPVPDVVLPEHFAPSPYAFLGTNVPLAASVTCDLLPTTSLANLTMPAVAKTGTTAQDFRISVAATFGSTIALEIYVKFHQ